MVQAASAQAQQQLVAQEQHQAGSPAGGSGPEPPDSVSPQKMRALQESMQDMHAEVAELRNIVHQKNAELDTLHRCLHMHTSHLGAARSRRIVLSNSHNLHL